MAHRRIRARRVRSPLRAPRLPAIEREDPAFVELVRGALLELVRRDLERAYACLSCPPWPR